MEVGCQLQTPSTLHTVKEPLIPTEQETGWAPESVWTFCRRQKSLTFAGSQTTDCPAHSSVTITTTLSQHTILHSCPKMYQVHFPLRSPVLHDKMYILYIYIFFFFGPCIFNMEDKKINQQNAQINSGLVYY